MSQAEPEDAELLAPSEEAELLAALEAALRPGELAPRDNERLLAMALSDPLAPPTEAELLEAARLRKALAKDTSHEDAALLRALGAPFHDARHDEAVARALEAALGANAAATQRPRRNVVYAAFGTASAVLAAAAAILLLLEVPRAASPAATAGTHEFVKPRSTAPLFAERFETGDTTARMDLIASARGRDLRDNRYAAWGVR